MKPPAFQFYPSDFLASTSEMDAEEVGVYIRLLCHQWLRGGLPDDEARLMAMGSPCEPIRVATRVAYVKSRFVRGADGMLRHPRMEAEREKQTKYRSNQAELARKRWVGIANPDAKSCGLAQATQCPPSPSPSPSLIPALTLDEGTGVRGATPKLTDDAWLVSLVRDPAYAGLDVMKQHAKMVRWCKENRKQPTRRRFINWLNRADEVIPTNGTLHPDGRPRSITHETLDETEKALKRLGV